MVGTPAFVFGLEISYPEVYICVPKYLKIMTEYRSWSAFQLCNQKVSGVTLRPDIITVKQLTFLRHNGLQIAYPVVFMIFISASSQLSE